MDHGVAGAFAGYFGDDFVGVEGQTHLHKAEEQSEEGGEGDRHLNQRASVFFCQRVWGMVESHGYSSTSITEEPLRVNAVASLDQWMSGVTLTLVCTCTNSRA